MILGLLESCLLEDKRTKRHYSAMLIFIYLSRCFLRSYATSWSIAQDDLVNFNMKTRLKSTTPSILFFFFVESDRYSRTDSVPYSNT